MAALAIDALLDGLNPEQRAAVVHEGSPLLIVAGAGSGKTRVLTHRIAYLLAARDVAPHEILAITFTNKAAGEMATRVAALVGPRARSMWVMTFHSACVRILRREAKRFGYPSSFSIYDQADSQRLMALTCRELDLDAKQFPPKAMAGQVSNLKNELIDHETFAARAATARERALAEAYSEYQRRLFAAGAMDFDDLIMVTVNLFQAIPEVAEQYRRRFRHVLVDEYQDTNHAQYILVRELVGGGAPLFSGRTEVPDTVEPAAPPSELCVVGDADQSIYAFRGATIRNIVEFEQDYPDAKVILLEQNYRSTQNILAAANAVVSQNQGRKPKNLWSDQGAGAPIVGYVADNEHDEAAFVAEEVDRLTDAGQATPGQVAVFYRTNAQSRVFEEVFIRVGLPYRVVGGVRFYERREVRDLLAYLRLIANPADEVSLRRVLNVPKRGIGDRAEEYVAAFAQRERITFAQALARPADVPGMAARSASAIAGFNALINGLRELTVPVADLAEAVLDRTGYIESLESSSDLQDASRVENLEELVSVAREFDGAHDEEGTLSEFLEQVSLV
ncbi:MAG: UvrD-helicase domain-containing protein, partial [Streptosporangiaceae bacterium]